MASSRRFPEPTHRVVFQDRINAMNPWVIQAAVLTRDTTTNAELISNNGKVRLINAKSGEYLAADSRYRSIIDRHLYLRETGEETFFRFHVGAMPNPGPESVWELQYSRSDGDAGFRLWNILGRCYLATSFRTFPDYDGMRTNDTVLHQLKLELETVCSTMPLASASTLFAVDGEYNQTCL
ncbi:hypothetical protein F5Y14DRAFT_413181 [Nemania sp. NC0429]|nr:hypothetical protein F5Y14DRAFT_413181 [Nemania sp. NC0429]